MYNLRSQYIDITQSFYENYGNKQNTLTQLVDYGRISNDFANNVRIFYQNLLAYGIGQICDDLYPAYHTYIVDYQVEKIWKYCAEFISQYLPHDMLNYIDNNKLKDYIIEDYIMERTTEYYNGIKEWANDTMNKLKSYNMKDNDLKSCKEEINYILNMENDLKKLKMIQAGTKCSDFTKLFYENYGTKFNMLTLLE